VWKLNDKLDLHYEKINIHLKAEHYSVIYRKDYFEKYKVLGEYDNDEIDNSDFGKKNIEKKHAKEGIAKYEALTEAKEGTTNVSKSDCGYVLSEERKSCDCIFVFNIAS